MTQLTGNEYLDVRAVSPDPFRTAEAAGLVKRLVIRGKGLVVSIDAEASDVLALVSDFRQKLAMVNSTSLAVIGDGLKVRKDAQ